LAQVLCHGGWPSFAARYNIAPGQSAPVLAQQKDRREVRLMRWGLERIWGGAESGSERLINARAESLKQKPTFRQAYRQRRCLVPADGFYEWRTTPEGKVPFRFTLRDDAPFCFAGIWETWQPKPSPQGDLFSSDAASSLAPVQTFAIITTTANALVKDLHERMPVILAPLNFERWLNSATPPDELDWLLQPYPAELMACAPVSRRVNHPRMEGPECLQAD
jgi:putative SOS response-associated peptidase YedK